MNSFKLSMTLALAGVLLSGCYKFTEPPFFQGELVPMADTEFGKIIRAHASALPDSEETRSLRTEILSNPMVYVVSEDFLILQRQSETDSSWEIGPVDNKDAAAVERNLCEVRSKDAGHVAHIQGRATRTRINCAQSLQDGSQFSMGCVADVLCGTCHTAPPAPNSWKNEIPPRQHPYCPQALMVMTRNAHHLMFCQLMEHQSVVVPEGAALKRHQDDPRSPALVASGPPEAVKQLALNLSLTAPKACMALPFADASKPGRAQ